MNKTIKFILIIINGIMLIIAILWYLEKKEKEPLIVILGQLVTLILLFFEQKASKIKTKRIKNKSDLNINVASGDSIHTSDIDNSKVQITTKK